MYYVFYYVLLFLLCFYLCFDLFYRLFFLFFFLFIILTFNFFNLLYFSTFIPLFAFPTVLFPLQLILYIHLLHLRLFNFPYLFFLSFPLYIFVSFVFIALLPHLAPCLILFSNLCFSSFILNW